MLTDLDFTGTTFAVIDFETLTPAGRPPVPIEVAVISGRFTHEGNWAESGRFQSLMHPPYEVPFTKFDQAQTGLTRQALAGQRQHCPALSGTSLLCTVKLSRLAFPELDYHRLDTVLRFLGITIPPGRHRAMPDAELTVQVLKRALDAGQQRRLWTTLRDLDAVAGIAPRPTASRADASVQEALF